MIHGFVPSDAVRLHVIGEEGVLFDPERQIISVTSASATFIWCCLQEGLSPPDIESLLTRRFSMSPVSAAEAVGETIRQWRLLGLVGGRPGQSLAASDRESTPIRAPDHGIEVTYRFLDSVFRLVFSDTDTMRRVDAVLAPLATRPTADAIRLVVERTADGFGIGTSAEPPECCEDPAQLVPMVIGDLTIRALQRVDGLCALHAAALEIDGSCVVMPGDSGRGKSTLAAALVAGGAVLVSDDTVVLDRTDLSVRPLPLGICLETGSWPVLTPFVPALAQLANHRSLDDRTVRYLVPPPAQRAPLNRSLPSSIIAFPVFDPTMPPRLVPLKPADTLRRLIGGFHPIAGHFDDAGLDRLIQWISTARTVEVRYPTLGDAKVMVRGLCRRNLVNAR